MALAWAAFLLAPAAWVFDQGLSYPLVKWACATGRADVLTAIAVIALSLTGSGLVLGVAALKGGAPRPSGRFVAILGIGFNVLVALLIVTALIPRYVLSPCE